MFHSIFGEEDSLLVEQSTQPVDQKHQPIEFSYNDFKSRYMIDHDAANMNCLPCDRVILKTSICAHLRLHHAITLSYNCELCSEGFQRSDYRQRHMKANHPEDFKCEHCEMQFCRSGLYKQHMMDWHKMNLVVPEMKSKDEVDVPLESLKFVVRLPDAMKVIYLKLHEILPTY